MPPTSAQAREGGPQSAVDAALSALDAHKAEVKAQDADGAIDLT